MILLAAIEKLYVIGLFPKQQPAGSVCIFTRDVLPAGTLQDIDSLVNDNENLSSVYYLSDVQEKEIGTIFKKMCEGKKSGHFLSDDNKKTYLKQLINQIVRIGSRVYSIAQPYEN